MKRILIAGLTLLSLGSVTSALAQRSRQYDDDIYGAKPGKAPQQETPAQPTQSTATPPGQQQADDGGGIYSSDDRGTASDRSYTRTYNDEYNDYDDDYYYSSHINRFNYPFYNQPYWSGFYNPYWYDPFWVDPYWGYSAWSRPALTISFGAGPYWSSYGGWQSWYGYGGFNSYYGYPGYGLNSGYYSGYWNGYYAGLYGGDAYGGGHYGGGRRITYGPRYSLNTMRSSQEPGAGYNGFRRTPGTNSQSAAGTVQPVSGFRNTGAEPARSEVVRGRDNAVRQPGAEAVPSRGDNGTFISRTPQAERPVRNGWSEDNRARANDAVTPAPQQVQRQPQAEQQQPRQERGGWFGRGDAGRSEVPSRSMEQPREQRSAQPSFERHESAPSRSFDGGGRSSGGGFGGGGGRSSDGGGGGRRR